MKKNNYQNKSPETILRKDKSEKKEKKTIGNSEGIIEKRHFWKRQIWKWQFWKGKNGTTTVQEREKAERGHLWKGTSEKRDKSEKGNSGNGQFWGNNWKRTNLIVTILKGKTWTTTVQDRNKF